MLSEGPAEHALRRMASAEEEEVRLAEQSAEKIAAGEHTEALELLQQAAKLRPSGAPSAPFLRRHLAFRPVHAPCPLAPPLPARSFRSPPWPAPAHASL